MITNSDYYARTGRDLTNEYNYIIISMLHGYNSLLIGFAPCIQMRRKSFHNCDNRYVVWMISRAMRSSWTSKSVPLAKLTRFLEYRVSQENTTE